MDMKNMSQAPRQKPKRSRNANRAKRRKLAASDEQDQAPPEKEVEVLVWQGIRHVMPYMKEYHKFAKARWFGKTIPVALSREFSTRSASRWQDMMEAKYVQVNGQTITDCSYLIKAGDRIVWNEHFHEPPVSGAAIEVLCESNRVLVVNKPASIPCYPSGPYHANSLSKIITQTAEPSRQNLHPVHRLDRLTSGMFVFAKDQYTAALFQSLFKNRHVSKTYLARVKGNFPLYSPPHPDPADSDASSNRYDNSADPEWVHQDGEWWLQCERPIYEYRTSVRHQSCVNPNDPSSPSNPSIGQVRQHEAKTLFRCEGYDAESDTSVVLCKPVTGRTHQIRVHLQSLTYPIFDDPFYDGTLYSHHAFRPLSSSPNHPNSPISPDSPDNIVWTALETHRNSECPNCNLSDPRLAQQSHPNNPSSSSSACSAVTPEPTSSTDHLSQLDNPALSSESWCPMKHYEDNTWRIRAICLHALEYTFLLPSASSSTSNTNAHDNQTFREIFKQLKTSSHVYNPQKSDPDHPLLLTAEENSDSVEEKQLKFVFRSPRPIWANLDSSAGQSRSQGSGQTREEIKLLPGLRSTPAVMKLDLTPLPFQI